MADKPIIMICNDDGYFAEGIRCLQAALAPLGRTIVVAPSQDNSGVSHKITINTALRLREMAPDFFTVTGTPVDCVHLGIHGVLGGQLPDLLVSGINHGPNLGEDTAYSGTVAAAYEGFVHGIPSFAVSTGDDEDVSFFEQAGQIAYRLAQAHFEGRDFLKKAVWNVNVPAVRDLKGMKTVQLDKRSFKSSVVRRTDPRGKDYYWIGPYRPHFELGENTDYSAYCDGFITLTPLKVDMTNREVLADYPEFNWIGS